MPYYDKSGRDIRLMGQDPNVTDVSQLNRWGLQRQRDMKPFIEQEMERQRQAQLQGLIGQRGGVEEFVPETFPGEDPRNLSGSGFSLGAGGAALAPDAQQATQQGLMGPGRPASRMATVTPGTGLLGTGDKEAFYAGLAGVPGYEEAGLTGLLGKQGATPFSKIDPSDYTPESLKAFSATNDYSLLKPRKGGAFEGTGFPAQAGNILTAAMSKLRQSKKLSSQDRDQVNFVAGKITAPRTITDAAGNVQTIPGQDLSNFAPLLRETGFGKTKPIETIKPKTPQQAAAITNAQSALKDIEMAKSIFFDEQGRLNRGSAFAANVPFIGGVPGTQGRDARQQVRRAIEIILRARSGAAVPPDEVDNYMDLYAPSINDSDQAAALKMQRLEEFFAGSLELMQAPSWKPENLERIRTATGTQKPAKKTSIDDLVNQYAN